MSIHRITRHPLNTMGGINKLKVPEGSTVIDVASLVSDSGGIVTQVLVLEPVAPDGEEVIEEEIKLLALNDSKPFNDPGEDKFFSYVGSAVWDNGYRVVHLFQIVEEDVWGPEDDFDEAVDEVVSLTEEEIEKAAAEYAQTPIEEGE